jgi:F-type H+-transporting ATPase subunit a
VLFAFFMQVLEVLVVFLQAYVFTLLSAVFIGLSRIEEHAEKE